MRGRPSLIQTLKPILALCAIFSLVAACSSGEQRNPVPMALMNDATPVGFDSVRIWGDFNSGNDIEELMIRRAKSLKDRFADDVAAGQTPKLNYLALSGGGQYGAFSAGILKNWTDSGTRPVFDAVSGISTGSIIAPFAFLGSEYDHILEEVYTRTSTEDMLTPTVFSGVLYGSALADTTPLKNKIAQYVTPELLERIAEEYRKGRLLWVGTTNIDVGRSVVWDMGAIAASGRPEALQLFRDVILASAAIPMAFPPVFFDVEAGGKTYREMHVDGGVTSQVNILSPQIPNYLMEDLVGFDMDRTLYVVVNGAVIPPPEVIDARTFKIAGASINTLWYAQAVGDLYKIHSVTERDEVAANYAWIPASFDDMPDEEFDPVFMKKLFDLGGALLRKGALWQDVPPNFTERGSTAVERGERELPVIAN